MAVPLARVQKGRITNIFFYFSLFLLNHWPKLRTPTHFLSDTTLLSAWLLRGRRHLSHTLSSLTRRVLIWNTHTHIQVTSSPCWGEAMLEVSPAFAVSVDERASWLDRTRPVLLIDANWPGRWSCWTPLPSPQTIQSPRTSHLLKRCIYIVLGDFFQPLIYKNICVSYFFARYLALTGDISPPWASLCSTAVK